MSGKHQRTGGIKKRDGREGYTVSVSFGMHPARVCPSCRTHHWTEVARVSTCSKCGVDLGPVEQRKLVAMRGGPKTRTRKLAEAERDRLVALRAAGKLPFDVEPEPTGQITCGEWFRQWCDSKDGLLRPSTVRSYRKVLLERARSLHEVPLSEVTKSDVSELLVAAAKEGLEPASVSRFRASMSACFLSAVRLDLIPRNPAEVPLPEKLKKRAPQTVDFAAVRRLRELAEGTPWEVPIALAGLGLRRSEVLGLRWHDIDLDDRTATVRHTLKITFDGDVLAKGSEHVCRASNRGTRSLVLEPPKSDDSAREVDLTDSVVTALRRQRAAQNERRLACGTAWHDHGFVCDRGDGRPLNPDSFSQQMKRLMARAGLDPTAHLHSLRHTSVVRQLERGVPVTAVARHHGHKDASVTMNVYGAHVTPAMRDAARAALEDDAATG